MALSGKFREHPQETIEQLCHLMVQLHSMDWQPFVVSDGVWPDAETARGIFDTA